MSRTGRSPPGWGALPPRSVGRWTATAGPARYRAADAGERAWDQTRWQKHCLLARDESLQPLVADKLAEDWSPEQIAGWLARSGHRQQGRYVSHETTYRSLFIRARGVLKKETDQAPAHPADDAALDQGQHR